MLGTSSRRTSGVWFGAFGPAFKEKLIHNCPKLIWKALCLQQAGFCWFCFFFLSFTSNDYNATANNLKFSQILFSLNCLNYAGKAMVSSVQPYSEGQSAFTRHHQSLIESFRIFLNPFLLEQSQDILRQQVFSDQALFASIEVQLFNRWRAQMALKLTPTNMAKHNNILETFLMRNQSNMLTGTNPTKKFVYFMTRFP